jgi:lipopolysaccharide transport system ATP-binding protein
VTEPAVRVVDLSKRLALGPARRHRNLREVLAGAFGRREAPAGSDHIWALRNVDLTIDRGEVVGIIGCNGAGKSTLLRILSRITAPTSGHAEIRGSVASLLEVGTGFHPELTGRENVYLNGAILGMRRAEIARKFDEIVDFAGVDGFLDTPVKRYSSGMRVRLAFAVAAHLEPEVLMIDEVLAVGDVAFQNKCLGKMGEVARSGRSVLFVSHNMAAVQSLCDRAVLLDEGRVLASGPVPDVIARYFERNREVHTVDTGPISVSTDGALTVHAIQTLDDRGEAISVLQAGQTFVVRVSMQAWKPIRRAVVHLSLNDVLGTRVVMLSTNAEGRELQIPAGESHVHCVVHDSPLVPTTYGVDLRVLVGTERILFQKNATTFVFEAGDFYKTGSLPAECLAGRVLVRQSWSVEPAADESDRSEPA